MIFWQITKYAVLLSDDDLPSVTDSLFGLGGKYGDKNN
jgi:hypothetical protein